MGRYYEPDDDEFTDDKLMDGIIAGVPGGGPLIGALTAPGGHWLSGTLRTAGRSAGEALLGGALGTGLAHMISAMPGHNLSPQAIQGLVQALQSLGAFSGAAHGAYASRRNQREDSGDYSAMGFYRDRTRQAKPFG